MTNLELQNRLGLVTSSTAGIDFAIAKALAPEGARVMINGLAEKRVKEAIAFLRMDVVLDSLSSNSCFALYALRRKR